MYVRPMPNYGQSALRNSPSEAEVCDEACGLFTADSCGQELGSVRHLGAQGMCSVRIEYSTNLIMERFAMKIPSWLVLVSTLATVAFSTPNYVKGVQIGQNDELIVKLKNSDNTQPVTCATNNLIVFYSTHASYKSFLSIALTALSTGMPIEFRASSCIGLFGVSNYAYTVNVGNSAYFEIHEP
jgi:hypothetical protein